MKRWFITGTTFAFLGILTLAAFSEMAESPVEPQPKLDHIVAPPAARNAEESRAMQNTVRLSDPRDEQQGAVAERFAAQPAPSIRATYFRSVLNSPDFHFKRWDLRILEVKSVEGVTRVKVRATPVVTSRFAAVTRVCGILDETYEIRGGNLNLLKTNPPVDPAVITEFEFDGF